MLVVGRDPAAWEWASENNECHGAPDGAPGGHALPRLTLDRVAVFRRMRLGPGYPRNNQATRIKIGPKIGIAYLPTYPKKLGHRTPLDSAMLLTMKFGPLPI